MTTPAPIELYDFEEALDDQRPLRIEWSYTIGGALAVVTEVIQLARQNLATSSIGPALASARLGYPELDGRILSGLRLEDLAAYSLERMTSDMSARDIDFAALMLGDQGRMLLVAKIVHEAAIRGYSPGMRNLNDFVDEASSDYEAQLEAIAVGRPGGQAILLDTDAVSSERPDTSYRAPLGPM